MVGIRIKDDEFFIRVGLRIELGNDTFHAGSATIGGTYKADFIHGAFVSIKLASR